MWIRNETGYGRTNSVTEQDAEVLPDLGWVAGACTGGAVLERTPATLCRNRTKKSGTDLHRLTLCCCRRYGRNLRGFWGRPLVLTSK